VNGGRLPDPRGAAASGFTTIIVDAPGVTSPTSCAVAVVAAELIDTSAAAHAPRPALCPRDRIIYKDGTIARPSKKA
jgi:hypothetical protein